MSTYKNNKNKDKFFYFSCAILAFYKKDDQPRQRHLNVLIELPTNKITQSALQEISRKAMERVQVENDAAPSDMLDVVILTISSLGGMTRNEFHDISENARADH